MSVSSSPCACSVCCLSCVACRAVPLPVPCPNFPGSSGFFPVLSGSSGLSGTFRRVLPCLPGSSVPSVLFRVLSGSSGFFRVLPGSSGFFRVLPGSSESFRVFRNLPAGRLRWLRRREPDAKIRKKRRTPECPPPKSSAEDYLTSLTIASNAFGSFMARSASTLRFRTIPLALSLPMNCE